MNIFSVSLRPVSLLIDEGLCEEARTDVQQIVKSISVFNLGKVADYVENLGLQWMRSGDWFAAGIVLMNLGDQMLILQMVAKAKDYYESALLRFHVQVESRHRQNEAAAMYGLALTSFLSGDYQEALRRLGEVMELLKKVEQHWISIWANYDNARFCAQAKSEIHIIQDGVYLYLLSVLSDKFGYGYFKRNAHKISTLNSMERFVLPALSSEVLGLGK